MEEEEFWSAEDNGLTLLDVNGGGETPRFSEGEASGPLGLLPVGPFGLWAIRLGFFETGAAEAGSTGDVGELEVRLEDGDGAIDVTALMDAPFPGTSPLPALAAFWLSMKSNCLATCFLSSSL